MAAAIYREELYGSDEAQVLNCVLRWADQEGTLFRTTTSPAVRCSQDPGSVVSFPPVPLGPQMRGYSAERAATLPTPFRGQRCGTSPLTSTSQPQSPQTDRPEICISAPTTVRQLWWINQPPARAHDSMAGNCRVIMRAIRRGAGPTIPAFSSCRAWSPVAGSALTPVRHSDRASALRRALVRRRPIVVLRGLQPRQPRLDLAMD